MKLQSKPTGSPDSQGLCLSRIRCVIDLVVRPIDLAEPQQPHEVARLSG